MLDNPYTTSKFPNTLMVYGFGKRSLYNVSQKNTSIKTKKQDNKWGENDIAIDFWVEDPSFSSCNLQLLFFLNDMVLQDE